MRGSMEENNQPFIEKAPTDWIWTGNTTFESDKLNLAMRTFWASDLHDGARVEYPSLLAHLGQRIILAGIKGSQNPYQEVIEKLKIYPTESLSTTILTHTTHSNRMTENDIRSNFEHFKNNPSIAQTDAFVCSFPTSFCEMWMPFNKTIIMLAGHRFTLGRCSRDSMQRLIEHVHMLANTESKPPNISLPPWMSMMLNISTITPGWNHWSCQVTLFNGSQ